MRLSGPAASNVSPVQLLLGVPIRATGVLAADHWWKKAEITLR